MLEWHNMDKLKTIRILILINLLVGYSFLFASKKSEQLQTYYSFTNFPILIYENTTLGFQIQQLEYLELEATSGDLNSSTNDLHVYYGGGYFTFRQNETVTLEASSDIDNVKVRNSTSKSWLALETGTNFTVTTNQTAVILWSISINPVLPILFIIGMIGMGAMFAGPLLAVQQIKKKNYREGLITGVTVTSLGLALFLAWL